MFLVNKFLGLNNKIISIVINEDEGNQRAIKLDTYTTLDSVRKQLASDIKMYDNMLFIGPQGAIINEQTIYLKDVLTGENQNILKIKKPKGFDRKELIDIFKLEYGLTISKDGTKHFENAFKDLEMNISNGHFYSEQESYKYNHQELYLKNIVSSLGAILPWSTVPSISAGIFTSYEQKDQDGHSIDSSTKCSVNYYVKLRIDIAKISPTDALKQSVNTALSSTDPYKGLQEITEKFGEYVVLGIEIGGKEIKIDNLSMVSQQKTDTSMLDTNINLSTNIIGKVSTGVVLRSDTTLDSSSHIESSYSNVFGGDKGRYEKGDFAGWRNSLDDFKSMAIISYKSIEPIFNVLESDMIQEIIKIIMGKKILHAGRIRLIDMTFSSVGAYQHELILPSKLSYLEPKECKIFASVSNLDDKSYDVFNIKITYVKNKIYFLLHVITHDTNNELNKREKRYQLEVGWLLIDYPKSLIDESKYSIDDTEIGESKVEEILQNKVSCFLTIPAYRGPENNISSIATGIFYHEKSSLKLFGYDVKFQEQSKIDQIDPNFKIEHCSIQLTSESGQPIAGLKVKKDSLFNFKKSASSRDIIRYENPPWVNENIKFYSLFIDEKHLGFATHNSKSIVFKCIYENRNVGEEIQISYFHICPKSSKSYKFFGKTKILVEDFED
ncbi:hypothetical protein RhiirA5_435080 [Rhizophagus irregularis]|uniref:MACPF domain-containing protein n=1 Tax=Rhizophagus irregularis TaxID=588596 RepID=A0A2N0NNZ1_9GLOM|nr:hypothetical protein RhiirA5_435080 [Rhizophagus irregularis]